MLHGFHLNIQGDAHIVDLAGWLSSLYTKWKSYVSIDPVYRESSYILTKSIQEQISQLFLVHWYDFSDPTKSNAESKLDEIAYLYANHPLIQKPSQKDISLIIEKLQESRSVLQQAIYKDTKFAIAKDFLYGRSNTIRDKELLYKKTPWAIVATLAHSGIFPKKIKNKIITLAEISTMSEELIHQRMNTFREKQISFYQKVQWAQNTLAIDRSKNISFLPQKIEDIDKDKTLKNVDYLFCNFLFNNIDIDTCISILQSLEIKIEDNEIYIATYHREKDIFSQLLIDHGASSNNGVLYRKACKPLLSVVREKLISLRKK